MGSIRMIPWVIFAFFGGSAPHGFINISPIKFPNLHWGCAWPLVHFDISWEEFRTLRGRFGFFDIPIRRSAGDPKSGTHFWNRVTLGSPHLPGQRHVSIGLELSGSPADTSPCPGRR